MVKVYLLILIEIAVIKNDFYTYFFLKNLFTLAKNPGSFPGTVTSIFSPIKRLDISI